MRSSSPEPEPRVRAWCFIACSRFHWSCGQPCECGPLQRFTVPRPAESVSNHPTSMQTTHRNIRGGRSRLSTPTILARRSSALVMRCASGTAACIRVQRACSPRTGNPSDTANESRAERRPFRRRPAATTHAFGTSEHRCGNDNGGRSSARLASLASVHLEQGSPG